MSFTSRLGSPTSYLGNIELGSPYIVDNPLIQTISQSLTITQTIGSYKISTNTITQTLALSQTVAVTPVRNRTISQTLSLTQTIMVTRTIAQTLPITQTIARALVLNRTIAQTLPITQTIGLNVILNRGITQTLSIGTSVNPSRKVSTQGVTQTLAISQTVQNIKASSAVNTLAISQTIAAQRVHILALTQTLSLSQVIARNQVKIITITDTLIFNPVKEIITPLHTDRGYYSYYLNNILVIKKARKCSVILTSNNRTIVLPCPQFGDTENNLSTMNLKRTMTGDTYTYIRNSSLKRLKYTFYLGRKKSLELQDFLMSNIQKVIKLENWKNEIWYVLITANPSDFTISDRYVKEEERVDVTLEFEGVLI